MKVNSLWMILNSCKGSEKVFATSGENKIPVSTQHYVEDGVLYFFPASPKETGATAETLVNILLGEARDDCWFTWKGITVKSEFPKVKVMFCDHEDIDAKNASLYNIAAISIYSEDNELRLMLDNKR